MGTRYRDYDENRERLDTEATARWRDDPAGWRDYEGHSDYERSGSGAPRSYGRRARHDDEPEYNQRRRDRISLSSERQPEAWGSQSGGAYAPGPMRSHLRCRDIMARAVVTCRRDTPIRQVARIMRDEDTGAVPVVSTDNTLDGIVTDRDIVVRGINSDKGDTELTAEDCMSTDIFCAHPNDRVVDVLEEMGDRQVRRIPIVDNRNRLTGMVSMADIAIEADCDRELAQAVEDISKPTSWLDRIRNYLHL